MTLTAQEVFDKGVGQVLKQGRLSVKQDEDGNSNCLYRGPNGSMCAAGPWLDDETAEWADTQGDDNGGMNIEEIHRQGRLPAELVPHLPLLNSMQWAHDAGSDSENGFKMFKIAARELAKNRGLEWNFGEEGAAA